MFAFRSVRLLGFAVAIALFGILVAAYFPGNRIAAEGSSEETLSSGSSGFKTDKFIIGNPSPSPTPEAEHWHVAAYYDLENFPSAKFLLNNKDIVAREVRVTLYSLEGLALEVPPVSIGATSAVMIDLAEWAKLGGEDFRRGSIKIFHTGKDRVIGSQVYLENTANGLSFEERLAELGKFNSLRLEGIWYMPRNQTDATIILSNTSDQLLTVNARLSKNPRQSGITEQFSLVPHQTRVLDLKTDFQNGADFALGRVVGLSLTHNGSNSDLKAHGLVSDLEKGYSNIISFTNPDTAKSSEFHGTGLHLGQFGGEELTPVVIVKNVGAVLTNITAKVNYTRVDGTTGSISLNPAGFRPGEMRPLNMDAVIHRAQKEQIEIAGIEVSCDAAPGSIVVSTQSIGLALDQVFRVPMFDPYAQVSSTGGYPWRIDATSTTFAYIKNTTSEEKEYVSYLTWESTEYMIGLKKIAPGQTVQIDVKKLRDQQIPDERGNLIPQNLTEGQLQWTIRAERFDESEPLKKFELVGRSEQIDLVNKTSSSYACQNCCQMWAVGWISSGGITEVEIGDQIQFTAYEQGTTCNGSPYGPYQISNTEVDWDSNNDNIATVSNLGLVTVVGVGSVEIDGDWSRPMTSNQGGWCPGPYLTGGADGKSKDETAHLKSIQNLTPDCSICMTEDTQIDSDIDLVAKPKVTNVTPNGATKISQIVGDQTIIHFVTPKGAANDQVTLIAELNPNTEQIRSQISWEGATESPSNPLEATIPKSSAGRNIVKIKYGTKVLKEMRVWVVWATIATTDVPSTIFNTFTGRPNGSALGIKGGYNFTHTIQPSTIITDSNRPNFSGTNSSPPPAGNHPFNGTSLVGGANRKWDNSRQIRFKIINPASISNLDTTTFTLPSFPANSVNYPANDVEGNDDTSANEETNDPYANSSTLIGFDEPVGGVCHRAGSDGDTFEYRYQFREFTRLEIEGTWYRISDYYPWRIHLEWEKVSGLWTGTGSSKALDNTGF